MRLRVSPVPGILACVCVFLATGAATAAHADLAFSGGTAAQQELLRNAYALLPVCCRNSRPVCVRLLDDEAMNACLQATAAAHSQRLVNAGAVDGFYQDTAKAITLRAPSPTADVSATFTHEYGHYVWRNILSPAQRDRYRSLYATQRSAHHLVSQYASVSVEEGFAEAFSFYVRQCSSLRQCDATSCDFLSNIFNAPLKR